MTLISRILFIWTFALAVSGAVSTADAQVPPPTFTKAFSPDTIGPGGVSTLTFTIDNSDGGAITDLDFTDTLPAAVTIAPGAPAFTCATGTLSAPAGGTTISFTNGNLGAFSVCTITVDVTSSTAGVHTNVSGDLTSSAGNSGTASDDLTVDISLPGFSKSFDDPTPDLGETVTMTYVIDNTANASAVTNLDFTETLPAGFGFGTPNNASTTCGTATIPPTLSVAGPTITLDANGTAGFPAVAAGASCTVTVDVLASVGGVSTFTSGELLADFTSAGKASAALDVVAADLNIAKDFLTNPVNAGSTTNLRFTLDNFNRLDPVTGVAFTDDLSFLSGLTYSGLVSNTCGGSVAGVGGSSITFSGGTIAAAAQCVIEVTLSVPAGASGGTYTNTTSAITGMAGGSTVTGNAASDDLIIPSGGGAPIVTLEILEDGTLAPDPTPNPGDDVVFRFTVTNTSTTNTATDVENILDLIPPLPFPVTVSLPPVPDPPCGAGSSLALISLGTDDQGLELTGGSLSAAPSAGSSCTFDVTLTLPGDLPGGTYGFTPEPPTATIGGATVTGTAFGDTVEVAAGLKVNFTKSFAGAVAPGGSVDLTFQIENLPESSDVENIEFTDDLGAMLTGATGGAPTVNGCGGIMSGAGSGLLTYSGGTLAAGAPICTITVPVTVPAGAASGNYPNTTEAESVEVVGSGVDRPLTSAQADLTVAELVFTKAFLTDPAIAGDTITLRFSIENQSPTDDATITLFTDNLQAELAGLAATGTPTFDDCGGTLSGTTFLTYTGGGVLAGDTCTIEVPVLVPAGAADGTYRNTTSSLSAVLGGTAIVADPATDTLTVQSGLLLLSKAFTDDPVAPGDTATLLFTLENSSSAAASGIGFTDDLGAMLTGATASSVDSNACTGATVDISTPSTVDVSGASLGAGATCTIEVSVSVPGGATAGGYVNTTSGVAGMIGGLAVSGDPATDTLDVSTVGTSFTKSFDGPVNPGETAILSFTITNPNAGTVTGLSFTDDLDAVLTGLAITSIPDPAPCGASSSLAGTGLLTFSDGEAAGSGGVCTFDVEVTVPLSATAGVYTNTTSDLTSSGLFSASPATADLTVIAPEPPAFDKAFADAAVDQGVTTTLTFTIDNAANTIAATGLEFTDPFPAGLVVAGSPGVVNGCGGTFTATAGDGQVALTGGTVAGGDLCTIDVTVQALAFGTLDNTTSILTSSLPDAAAAQASLVVDAVPLDLSMSFVPSTIGQFGTSRITLALVNTAAIEATGITLTDTLPADVVISPIPDAASTCAGGTLTAPAGGNQISYAGGALGAGNRCSISVNVTSDVVGTYPDTTEVATSTLGTSTPASATLTVEAATTGSITIVQNSDTDGLYDFTSTEPALTQPIEVSGGTGSFGPVVLPVGTYVINQTPPTGVGNSDITCDDANSTGDPVARTITINLDPLETVTCTINSMATLQQTVDTINRFLTKRADLILSSEPSAGRRFDRLNRGSGNATRFSWSPGDLQAFLPFTAEISRGSNEYRFSTSLVQMRESAASLKLAHGADKRAVYVDNYRFDAWFEAQYKQFDGGADGEGHFAIAYLGADYLVTPDILVGALLQIDDMEDRSAAFNSTARGTGWMIGPYMTARLSPNLYFDGRIAAGKSSNEVSPFNTYVDDFTTDRWMAMASLTGEIQRGAWTIRPAASLSYFQETQDGYVDSLGVSIPSQTVELGQIKLGPTFSGRFETDAGMIYSPYFSVDAIYNIGNTSGVTITNPSTPATEGWRARLQAGVDFTTESGARISFGGTYDGIGRSDFDVWGLMFDVTIPLQKAKAR